MHDYIDALEKEFKNQADAGIAKKQKAYLRDKFEFYGMTTATRRELQKPFLLKEFLPDLNTRDAIIYDIWLKPQREYHLFAQELMFKYIKRLQKEDIHLLEFMVVNNSWWDTVDYIAYKLMGAYFKQFPDQQQPYVEKWLKSDNIWLQRSALLFQLKYKTEIDTTLLQRCINALLGSKEFFINKAIGWVLREYSRTNPDWVRDFVSKTELSPLSRKESLRLID